MVFTISYQRLTRLAPRYEGLSSIVNLCVTLLFPKVASVKSHVNGFDALLAATEENLGKNISQDIEQSRTMVMDDFEKRCVHRSDHQLRHSHP